MKEIGFSTNTLEIILSLADKNTQIFFDGFGYIAQSNNECYIFYNTDELAESINGNDEAIILTSKIENEIDYTNYKLVMVGKITKIYAVQTVLIFSESHKIGTSQRIKDFFSGIKSKAAWKLFTILFSKTHSGYSSYCINPDKSNINERFPCNYIECGFLIEFDNLKCLPLFSNQNLIFMMEYKNQNTTDFINEWKDCYKFQLTFAST